MSQVEFRESWDSLAPLPVEGARADESIVGAWTRMPRWLRALGIAVALLWAGLTWYAVSAENGGYAASSDAFGALQQDTDGFWSCALPAAEGSLTGEPLAFAIHTQAAADGVEMAERIEERCVGRLVAAGMRLTALDAPAGIEPQLQKMAAANGQLLSAWRDYAAALRRGDPAADVGGITRAQHVYLSERGAAERIIRAKTR